TPASFEPTIDYVVTKIPRFNFEKFAGAEDRLTTQMKSVGEVMAIGRNQQESLQKALRGLEVGVNGFDSIVDVTKPGAKTKIMHELQEAGADRIWYIADAFRLGLTLDDVFRTTKIDRWFLVQIQDIVKEEQNVYAGGMSGLTTDYLRKLKRKGFSDHRLADVIGVAESEIRKKRHKAEIFPVYKRVDTCAGEFNSDTAYMYSTYDEECEANPTDNDKIMIIGGGPNRIGQGIEFDYCCVHAALALREDGYETIMVNCNPETVSTDYDTSDRLYFESITFEDVLEIVRIEKPKGVIVQYGGQTPLKLARSLEAAGVPIIGTSPDAIDRAEDRERFQQAVDRLGLLQPENATVTSLDEAMAKAETIGFPLVVRPSYVLGGRAMEIVYDLADLRRYMTEAVSVSNDSPVLLDHFLDDAIEVDIDVICDGTDVVIGGIMQHIEQAGVHSGDSACSLPPYSLSQEIQDVMRKQVTALAFELGVVGLMNTQMAVKDNEVYLIEVNPRAARTVPFVSKATSIPLAKVAARVMAGTSLKEQGITTEVIPDYFSVKEVVIPFNKFHGSDPLVGPEMRSTGEVMGTGETFEEAYAKANLGAGVTLPKTGRALISVRNSDKERIVDLARQLVSLGFKLDATHGTAIVLGEADIPVRLVNKVEEGRPHIVDRIKNGEYSYIINTTEGRKAIEDSKQIRGSALRYKATYTTTLNAAFAACMAHAADDRNKVSSIQELHKRCK
ncbi:MAG: carbamoyl-phosphate synthase large subunit, partial [Thalassotalea sp.]|nr:carbamoyl-phosphate synthase large subunit [Thalassotalea sp.]